MSKRPLQERDRVTGVLMTTMLRAVGAWLVSLACDEGSFAFHEVSFACDEGFFAFHEVSFACDEGSFAFDEVSFACGEVCGTGICICTCDRCTSGLFWHVRGTRSALTHTLCVPQGPMERGRDTGDMDPRASA